MQTATQPTQHTPTIEELQSAFNNSTFLANSKIKFSPEIKVKREHDVLYISAISKSKVGSLIATVEVYHPSTGGDKAPMPVTALDGVVLRAILSRLS